MHLSEFRTMHPGLYQQATDAGIMQERDRQHDIRTLAKAAGAPSDRALDGGWTVAEAAEHFRQHAAKSDERSAAFAKALDEVGVTAIGGGGGSAGDDDLRFAARFVASVGRPPAPGIAAAAPADLGDLMASALPPARESSTSAAQPSTPRPSAPASNADLGDLMVDALPQRKAVGQ